MPRVLFPPWEAKSFARARAGCASSGRWWMRAAAAWAQNSSPTLRWVECLGIVCRAQKVRRCEHGFLFFLEGSGPTQMDFGFLFKKETHIAVVLVEPKVNVFRRTHGASLQGERYP